MDKASFLRRCELVFSPAQALEIACAIDLATEKHQGQKRKSGDPYITHPLAVAEILLEWGMDIDTIIAGILHDTIEDTDLTLAEIERHHGRDVAFLVDGVTKVSLARAGMRPIDSYLPQTRDNLSKLLIAVGQDVRVLIIKLADRLHNMRTLRHLAREKQLKIARETLDVFAPLADRLNMGRVRVELEELSFKFLEPKEYHRLNWMLRRRLGASHRKLAKARQEVTDAIKIEHIAFTIDGRIKSVYSLHKKLHKKGGDIDKIYDLIALRIIVSTSEECYKVLNIIHSLYEPKFERIKDYIAHPKLNGYQSLHTAVVAGGKVIEFQIRTELMHEYAERGLAASFHYNEQKLTDAYRRGAIAAMPANLQWITRLQEDAVRIKSGDSSSVGDVRLDLFADRMFIYSPQGDIYDLPVGAYPLDFAYRVHSDLGNSAAGFLVNGKMSPFDKPLQDGDRVEIITKKNVAPKKDWLDYIATSHARVKIKQALNKNNSQNSK